MPADSLKKHLVATCVFYVGTTDLGSVSFMSNVLQTHEEHWFREGRRLVIWEGKDLSVVPSNRRTLHRLSLLQCRPGSISRATLGIFAVNAQ